MKAKKHTAIWGPGVVVSRLSMVGVRKSRKSEIGNRGFWWSPPQDAPSVLQPLFTSYLLFLADTHRTSYVSAHCRKRGALSFRTRYVLRSHRSLRGAYADVKESSVPVQVAGKVEVVRTASRFPTSDVVTHGAAATGHVSTGGTHRVSKREVYVTRGCLESEDGLYVGVHESSQETETAAVVSSQDLWYRTGPDKIMRASHHGRAGVLLPVLDAMLTRAELL